MLEYNLQFFAKDGPGGEKTEPATPKKLEEARKEGQVAKSREIANGMGLMALFLVLKSWTGKMGVNFLETFESIYNRIPQVTKLLEGTSPINEMTILLRQGIVKIVTIILPILLIGFVVAFVSDFVQVKWKPSSSLLKPKFSKMNPINGIKRLFSIQSLVELLKAFIKITIIVWIAYSYMKDKLNYLYLLYDMEIMPSLQLLLQVVTDLGIRISAVYLVFSLGDYAYQKWKFSEDMKMTKQEVKDEYKNAEGDPQVKGKIRSKMMEVSRRRMMQALPQADVVITNPTHYAVAIKYDPAVSDAPVVIAKGQDYLAQKIKEIAREHKVEIVENKPLARMLFANVEVGEAVPPELYQAVAEVLAFVYHLQGRV
ncbi:MAG: flagellar biosynthesis protein FlhB [Lachnospiraceae bacterium]|nr:flagellar biosynthesis protein FlhB [Lachnospiraceae bacterium]